MMSFCGHWSVFLQGQNKKNNAAFNVGGGGGGAQKRVRSLSKDYSQILPLVHVHLTRQRARQFGV